jgi:hypothetical protein
MRKSTEFVFSLILLAAIMMFAIPIVAQNRGPSTSEERARAVQVAKALRADPTADNVQPDREWFVKWLIEIPDITVKLCPSIYGDLGDPKSGNAGALIATLTASEVAFVIENPKKTKDDKAISYAGLDGLLDGYQAIQKKDPNYKLPQLDQLLKTRADGKLDEYVRDAVKKCK